MESVSDEARPRRRPRLRTLAWGGAVAVLLLALLAALVLLFFSDVVTGPSMEPGLHPGDRVVVNPLAYRFGHPQRGDIVRVNPPAGPRAPAVKRVVAVPGDQVEIVAGAQPAVLLRVGGRGPWIRLTERYVFDGSPGHVSCCDPTGRASLRAAPYTLPPDRYFVLGDNRNVSLDSRDYGPVAGRAITGRVVWRLLPLSRFGSL